jgi:hypothetical protein
MSSKVKIPQFYFPKGKPLEKEIMDENNVNT